MKNKIFKFVAKNKNILAMLTIVAGTVGTRSMFWIGAKPMPEELK